MVKPNKVIIIRQEDIQQNGQNMWQLYGHNIQQCQLMWIGVTCQIKKTRFTINK